MKALANQAAAAAAAEAGQPAQSPSPSDAPSAAARNPQLADTAKSQRPVAMNAAEAADATDRAGRHESRVGNQPGGEQLQALASTMKETLGKELPAAREALMTAAKPAQAAPPVGEAAKSLANNLKSLQAAMNGQSQAAAQTWQRQTPAGEPQTPAGTSAAAAQPAPAGQGGNASTAEQQAMARALDALDQQLNPSAPQQSAGEGESQQPGQPGQQGKGEQGQQAQNGSKDAEGNQSGQPGQQGQPGQAQAAAQSAMAQAAQAAQTAMRMDRAQSSATQPGSLLGSNQSEKSMGGAKAEGTALQAKDLPDAQGLKRGDWGRLPKKLAEQLTKGSQESIPGEYRQAVETYYRVIAEKTKKRP